MRASRERESRGDSGALDGYDGSMTSLQGDFTAIAIDGGKRCGRRRSLQSQGPAVGPSWQLVTALGKPKATAPSALVAISASDGHCLLVDDVRFYAP